ncbi:ATP-binding protein [Kitasatospora sp. NPDC002227]|uniref:ATP-binding protein n=1 Tax=Kitasatospora sp. NPDC002227 TaxID=3154773 RepID=UPI003323D99A
MTTQVLTSTEPTAPPTAASLDYEPQSASAARELVRDALVSWGLKHLVGDAELVVTELVTNAAKTGCTTKMLVSAERVTNRVGRAVRLSVRDGSCSLPVLIPGADGESGRGLVLVDGFAVIWGVDLDPYGKTVWADLSVDRT